MHTKTLSCLMILTFQIVFSLTVKAQESTPNPTPTPSAEIQKLQKEKEIKTLQKDIAEAEKAIRDVQLKPSGTPLAGDATLEDVKIESHLVTYRAMSSLLDNVAGEIKEAAPNAERFVVYSPADVNNLNFYLVSKKGIEVKIENDRDFYKLLLIKICEIAPDGCEEASQPKPPPSANFIGPLSSAIGALGLLADAVAFLRSETKIKGIDVKIEDDVLNTEVFRKLRGQYPEKSIQIIFPQNLSAYENSFDSCFEVAKTEEFKNCPDILSSLVKLSESHGLGEKVLLIYSDENKSNIESGNSKISGINKEIANFEEKILKLKVDSLKASSKERAIMAKTISIYEDEINKLKRGLDENKTNLKQLMRLKFLLDALQKHNEKVIGFVNDFITIKDDGSSKLLNYLRGEKLSKVFSDEKGYWLEMKSVVAGGNNRTRKNLIRYIFGAKIDHSGGIILSWRLYNRDGTVRDSDVTNYYEGYKTSKEIKSGN